jgi:hypothetical protein
MSRRRIWIVSFIVWTGAGAFDVGQAAAARGAFLLPNFVLTFESMWLWALFTPLVMWLCLRLPLDRARRARSVAVHAAAAALAVVDVIVDTPFFAWLWPEPGGFLQRLAVDSFLNVFSYVAIAGVCYALAYGRQLAERRARDARERWRRAGPAGPRVARGADRALVPALRLALAARRQQQQPGARAVITP